jgi:hypothetical protein
VWGALVAALGCASCATGADRPPIARITATPTAILVHDDFQTAVKLDATASGVVDGDAALDYAWEFVDDEGRTDDTLNSSTLTVRFRGDRPPRVVLTVTNGDLAASVTLRIQLTLP